MSAGGLCEVTVTAITRCGWVMFSKSGELLHGKNVYSKADRDSLEEAFKSSNFLSNSGMAFERNRMGILKRTKIHGDSNILSTDKR